MKIELKNVKYSEHLSEETNAFTADVYIDNKKVLSARNDGKGGATRHDWDFPRSMAVFNKIQDYCLSLPPKEIKTDYATFVVKMNLENKIDELFEEWLFINSIKSHFTKKICYGNPNDTFFKYKKFSNSIAQLKKTEGGRVHLGIIISEIKSKLAEGERIFNTNLKEFL